MKHLRAYNVPEAFAEMIRIIPMMAAQETSRNGSVMTVQWPFMLEIENPKQRVLFDAVRDANPFFHVMEFVWMMAGSNKVKWLAQFNKRMMEYSDDNMKLGGAYGFRWRNHFMTDQIVFVVEGLSTNKTDRRMVLNMWDPHQDLGSRSKDIPCNTHIYFRVVDNRLNMTVCNRSNDLIWGMLGANAVHMTLLHEFIAKAVGVEVGTYYAFTNNLHIYNDTPNVQKILDTCWVKEDRYIREVNPYPIMENNNYLQFLADAEAFIEGKFEELRMDWFINVAKPIHDLWFNRTMGVEAIKAEDWRMACSDWLQRRGIS